MSWWNVISVNWKIKISIKANFRIYTLFSVLWSSSRYFVIVLYKMILRKYFVLFYFLKYAVNNVGCSLETILKNFFKLISKCHFLLVRCYYYNINSIVSLVLYNNDFYVLFYICLFHVNILIMVFKKKNVHFYMVHFEFGSINISWKIIRIYKQKKWLENNPVSYGSKMKELSPTWYEY